MDATAERAPRADAPGIFGRERRRLTFGILLAIALFALDGMGVVPALPVAVRELDGLAAFAWAFSAFMLAWLVGTVAAGLLADARGPRLPMAAGLGAFAVGLVVAGAAQHMAVFVAGRVLQGAGGGGIMAAAFVSVARGYPDHMRARMMALTASVWILPAVLGPALSGVIAEYVGWRYVFLGIVPCIAVAAWVVVPPLGALDTRQSVAGRRRLVAAFAAAAGAAGMLGSAGLFARSLPLALVCLVGGALLFVPALRALLPPGTFRARHGLPAGLVARALLSFAFFGTEALIPLVTGELRGATPIEAGMALTAGALGWISASWSLDRMEARAGAKRRVIAVGAGFVAIALGTGLVALVILSSLPLPLLLLGWAISGAGMGFAYSAGSLLCIAAARPGEEGEVSGQLQVAEALSSAAGTGLGGALANALITGGFSAREGYGAVFAVTILAALAGSLLTRRLATRGVPG